MLISFIYYTSVPSKFKAMTKQQFARLKTAVKKKYRRNMETLELERKPFEKLTVFRPNYDFEKKRMMLSKLKALPFRQSITSKIKLANKRRSIIRKSYNQGSNTFKHVRLIQERHLVDLNERENKENEIKAALENTFINVKQDMNDLQKRIDQELERRGLSPTQLKSMF